jgi:hypothetical protein
MAEEPTPERASVVSAGVQRIRTGLATAGSAAKRPMQRLRHGGEVASRRRFLRGRRDRPDGRHLAHARHRRPRGRGRRLPPVMTGA